MQKHFLVRGALNSRNFFVKKAGGKVTMPKQLMMGMGQLARISDTEDNIIGLWEPVK